MKIEYVGRGYTVDEATRQYTEEKLRKALKFLDEPVEAHVALVVEKHEAVAELHLNHRFGALHSRETAPQMLDAINAACDHLETQAERARKKFMDRRRRARREEPPVKAPPAEPLASEA